MFQSHSDFLLSRKTEVLSFLSERERSTAQPMAAEGGPRSESNPTFPDTLMYLPGILTAPAAKWDSSGHLASPRRGLEKKLGLLKQLNSITVARQPICPSLNHPSCRMGPLPQQSHTELCSIPLTFLWIWMYHSRSSNKVTFSGKASLVPFHPSPEKSHSRLLGSSQTQHNPCGRTTYTAVGLVATP